jgi:hypothetical protein
VNKTSLDLESFDETANCKEDLERTNLPQAAAVHGVLWRLPNAQAVTMEAANNPYRTASLLSCKAENDG